MLHNCNNKKINGQPCEMNLEKNYLKNLYNEQNGLCYISKMKMSLKIHSDFKISIERLDESIGYVKGNIKFICLEFQNASQQWTPLKFDTFCNSFQTKEENIIQTVELKGKRKSPQKYYNNSEKNECLCRICDTIKDYEFFSNYGIKHGKCRECHKKQNDKRNNPSLNLKLSI
jgi:hypothetical protein